MEIEVEYLTTREYIRKRLLNAPMYLQTQASEYTEHAKQFGGRICNDGYPDSRFKCTFDVRFEVIRHFISKQRQCHSMMMHKMCKQQTCCTYKAVSQEVALSNIDKLRSMLVWGKK